MRLILLTCLSLLSCQVWAQSKFSLQGLSYQHQTLFLSKAAQHSLRQAALFQHPVNWSIENVQTADNAVPIRYSGPRLGVIFGWGDTNESKLTIELGVSAHTWRGPTYGREGERLITSTTSGTSDVLRKDSIMRYTQLIKPQINNILGLDATIRWRFTIDEVWQATLGAKIAFASAQQGVVWVAERQSTYNQYYINGERYEPINSSSSRYINLRDGFSGKGMSPYFFRATAPLQVDATLWQNVKRTESVGLLVNGEVGIEKWGFIPTPYLIWGLSAGFRYTW